LLSPSNRLATFGPGPAPDQAAELPTEGWRRSLHRAGGLARVVFESRPLLLVLLIGALSLFLVITQPDAFPTWLNIQAVLLDSAQFGILAVGMMILLIGGVFDLSIGATLALSGVVAATLIKDYGVPAPLGFALGLVVGGMAGGANGLIVTKLRINALIATLATLGIFRSITQLISGTGVYSIDEDFEIYGQTQVAGLQMPVWIMFFVVLAGWVAVSRTRYFRRFFYVGGNRVAAARAGIRVDRLILFGFVLMGVLAGLAGVLLASRLNNAVVTAGIGVELKVITAVVLGGASLSGGVGTIPGAFLGVIFISLVQNALILSRVPVYWQGVVVGGVLILAVATDLKARREE
jgi:ribose transport system permease protein